MTAGSIAQQQREGIVGSRYLIAVGRKVLQSVFVFLLVYIGVFLVLTVLPGDAITTKLSDPDLGYTAEQIEAIKQYYGLDQPIIVQLLSGLIGVLSGNFGYSLTRDLPVNEIIRDAIPSTVLLALLALAFAVVLAFLVSYFSVNARHRWLRAVLVQFPVLFSSVPAFVVGLILLQVISFQFGLFSTIRSTGNPLELVVPAIALAVPISAPLAQVFSTNLAEAHTLNFAKVLEARGLGRRYIFWNATLKFSAIPFLTLTGIILGELLTGSILIEAIFSRNGLGTVIEGAVAAQDTPLLQGITLFSAAVFIIVNLIVDVLYPVLDPRLRRTKR